MLLDITLRLSSSINTLNAVISHSYILRLKPLLLLLSIRSGSFSDSKEQKSSACIFSCLILEISTVMLKFQSKYSGFKEMNYSLLYLSFKKNNYPEQRESYVMILEKWRKILLNTMWCVYEERFSSAW